jgi:hypothetical protein
MAKGVELEDFMRNKVIVHDEDELYALYKSWESQRVAKAIEKIRSFGQDVDAIEPDPYLDWLVKRGICPHAIVSENSKYHFESIVILDSEMGVKMPDPVANVGDNPAIFFQSLNIVREQRRKAKEDNNG